jgi:hypothetical protein
MVGSGAYQSEAEATHKAMQAIIDRTDSEVGLAESLLRRRCTSPKHLGDPEESLRDPVDYLADLARSVTDFGSKRGI